MIDEYPETSRKRIYMLLFLLILLGGLAVYFGVNAKEPKPVLSARQASPEGNRPHTDPNQPSTEPGRPPVKPNISSAEPKQVSVKTNQPSSEPDKPAGSQSEEVSEKKPLRPLHRHRAFYEKLEERTRMVDWQIEARSIKDPNVLMAMRVVPRHFFVPQAQQRFAYTDRALPIDDQQTISQPYIVAFMTEALKLTRNSKVLEIGTGSGYQAAVCAEIAKEVYTIEIVKELAESAKKRLKELGYRNVFVKTGDGYYGWPEQAPFDAIIGTASAGRIPKPLIDQLKPGGRMILPFGSSRGFQYLVLITKDKNGNISSRNVMPVQFVPMTGQIQKPEKESKE
jgi:protein-L-isoaspartate(D-aspartate) O-methyltransferase